MALKNYRRSAALAAGVALALALSACASASASSGGSSPTPTTLTPNFSLGASGTLTVAVNTAEPPFISYDNGKLGGLIGDTINGFAAEYGLTVKLDQTTFASALLDVQQGRADMAPNIFYTPERATSVYYTASSVRLPVAVVTKKGFKFTGTASLKNKKIGIVVGEAWASALEQEYGAGSLVQFQSETEAGQALINGQVDAYVNGLAVTTLPPLAGRKDIVGHPVKAGQAGIPASLLENVSYNLVSCQNPALAKAYDKYVNGLVKSGGLAKLNKKNKVPAGFQISKPAAPAQGCGS
jgi:polar amino acid transport system substrate-binding protein